MNRIAVAAYALAIGSFATIASAQTIASPQSMKWGPAPAFLPAGAKITVLEGDPTKSGPFTVRLNFPPGYRIPPHFHPTEERVTVLSGHLNVGMGDKFDAKKTSALHAGAFGVIPANMHHYASSTGRTIIQLHGTGPFALNYVNPADTPKPR